MKKIFLLAFLGILGICTRVVAQDAATLFQRANDQYALFKNEQSRENSSAVMYTHLYECYELYVKVLEAPSNKSYLTGTKNRLRSIYPDLMNGAAYFLNNKQLDNFLNLATAYIELPKLSALRSENFSRNEQYSDLLYQTARGYMDSKKYDQGIKYFKEYKGTNPTDERLRDTYTYMNMAYLAEKNYVQQELILQEAVVKFPLSVNFLGSLYNLYITTSNLQKLAEVADRILKIEPNNTQVLSMKANLLMRENKISEAFPIYERLYKLEPDNLLVLKEFARANYNVGVEIIQNAQTKSEEAMRAAEKQRGMDYIEESQILFQTVLEKDPKDKNIMKGLSLAYLLGGKEAEGKVLKSMADEGLSYDNFQARLVAYNEVHVHEESALGGGTLVSTKPLVAPDLVISSVRLLDGNGKETNVIEAGERFKIEFSVQNKGKGNAYNLRLSLLEEQGNESFFEGAHEMDGEHLKPGESRSYLFDLIASNDMPSFLANIEIRANEQNGFDADKYTLKVNTMALAIPRLVIAEHLFSSSEGSSITKNSNGKLKLAVRNEGAKTARKVKLNFAWPLNVYGDNVKQIDSIMPGKNQIIEVDFSVNKRFDGEYVAVNLAANDEQRLTFLDETFKVKLGEYLDTGGLTDLAAGTNVNVKIEEVALREENELLENIPEGAVNPHRYALIIGNEHYSKTGANAEIDVPYAIRDAYVFQQYCIRTFGIPENQIVLRADATAGLMNEDLLWLINVANADPDAEIFFYYSGHGNNHEATKEAYLMPTDITGRNITLGISLSDLYKRLGSLSIKGAYVFLDACFSGGYKSAKPLLSQKAVRVEPKVGVPHGHTISFASSSGEQTSSVFNEKKQGYFTFYLIKTLQDAKGNLTLQEWFTETANEVKKATALINKPQSPNVILSQQDWPGWYDIKLMSGQ